MTLGKIGFAVLICLVLAPLPALAHKVTVFAWVEGSTIHTESKFSGGRKVSGGKIEVFDENDRIIVKGTTDDRGKYDFPRPRAATALKVVLTAGMGHTNYWLITADELGGGETTHRLSPSDAPAPAAAAQVPVDAAAIEAVVERAVERKLAPLRAQLAQEAWGLRDIVAGVGYILGLMGLASYIHYRKAARSKG